VQFQHTRPFDHSWLTLHVKMADGSWRHIATYDPKSDKVTWASPDEAEVLFRELSRNEIESCKNPESSPFLPGLPGPLKPGGN
jgi:hypothetical protein